MKLHSEQKRRWPAAVCVLLLTILFAHATAGASAPSSITAYDVDITAGIDNVYSVVETITMQFAPDSGSHGLYMSMDLTPYVFFEEDGEFYARDYTVLLRNLHIDGGPYETEQEDGLLTIRIGDPDVVVDGETRTYTISYDYDPGDDGFPEFDMFYFAIIGDGWSEEISDITFSVHMPEPFDEEKIGFSVGAYGAEGYDPATLRYSVNGTDITGTFLGTLQPYEGIWMRVSLPADYFVNTRSVDPAAVAVIWVSAALGGIMAVLFLIFRPRRRPVVTVEFSAPDGLTSADVGYVVDGMTETRDVVSLLIYWAGQGYLKIVEKAEAPDGKKRNGVVFVRLRDLPATANTYEQLMFDKLFESGPRVSTDELRYNFAATIRDTVKRIDNKFTDADKRVFTHVSCILSDICSGLSALPSAFMAAIGAYYWLYETAFSIVAGVLLFISGYLLAVWFSYIVRRWKSVKLSVRRWSVGGWIAVAAVYYGLILVSNFRVFGWWGLAVLGIGLGLTVLAPFFRRRTERGERWMGQILGLRRFIERAEKGRLEKLVSQNPEYFYDILPYAYVLGVSDTWAKQFESLAVGPPDWYQGADFDTFTTGVFLGSLMHSMDEAQSALTAVRSEGGSAGSMGGGGGFSGGGFSGGGFGGRGGGSW